MGLRRMGSPQRRRTRAKVKRRNGLRKTRERISRDRRMLAIVQAGPLPYQPWVMSWLCDRTGVGATSMTQDIVTQVIDAYKVEAA